jgi:hypothetical protein
MTIVGLHAPVALLVYIELHERDPLPTEWQPLSKACEGI